MHPVALYVGAGIDLAASTHLPPSHRLVCVDGQPFSEFGTDQCDCHVHTNCFSRPRFLADLDRSAKEIGVRLTSETTDVRDYGDRIRYYTNTAVPQHTERFRKESPFSTLIVRGYHPHVSVLELLAPFDNTFVGCHDTIYTEFDTDTVVHALHTCPVARAKFRCYTLVLSRDERVHCDSWKDFLRLSTQSKKIGGP